MSRAGNGQGHACGVQTHRKLSTRDASLERTGGNTRKGRVRYHFDVGTNLLKGKVATKRHKARDVTFETCDRDACSVGCNFKRRRDTVDVQGYSARTRVVDSGVIETGYRLGCRD